MCWGGGHKEQQQKGLKWEGAQGLAQRGQLGRGSESGGGGHAVGKQSVNALHSCLRTHSWTQSHLALTTPCVQKEHRFLCPFYRGKPKGKE